MSLRWNTNIALDLATLKHWRMSLRWNTSSAMNLATLELGGENRCYLEEQDDPQIQQLQNFSLGTILDRLETQQSQPSASLFAWIIRRCGNKGDLLQGQRIQHQIQLHGWITSRYLCNLLVEMYGKCGEINLARIIFGITPRRNVFSWTILIAAHAQNGHHLQALRLLQQMDHEGIQPNNITFIELLTSAAALQSLERGKSLHHRLAKCGYLSDSFVANCLINMYAKCRGLEEAKSVFRGLSIRNAISWTALTAAYALNGHHKQAVKVFLLMVLEGVEPTEVTFVTVLDICADYEEIEIGREIHEAIRLTGFGTCLGNAMINMYGKCSSPDQAREVFEGMKNRDVITWNSMISVHCHNGYGDKALGIFTRMPQADGVTFTSALDACCCSSTSLANGRALHEQVMSAGRENEPTVLSALISMYGKCSKVELAREVFDQTAPNMNMVAWNSMMVAYAHNGRLMETLELFWEMNSRGIGADEITFIGVLFACSHAGLLKLSCGFYSSMISDFRLKPTSLQCGCLIDLMGRLGWLAEAEEFINSMPYVPDHTIWTILMGACITHADVERGSRAADKIMAMNPSDSGSYIAISNMYSLLEKWDEVARVRKLMIQRGVLKNVGKSSIEIDGVVHEFVAGDAWHPEKQKIFAEVRRLSRELVEHGYVPDTRSVSHGTVKEGKEYALSFHSERLAIAYGMISTPPGTTLRIIKNLRACPDCHSATKVISRITGRKIVVRDANRFHEVVNGSCSCDDYW